jgi:hypothetical protein
MMRHFGPFSPSRLQVFLALGGVLATAGTVAAAVGWARPAVAACLVDTGMPSGGFGLDFAMDRAVNYAGEFTVTQDYTIESVMGWLSNGPASGAGAEIKVSLHADRGDVPGATLFSKNFEPSPWIPDPNDPNKWGGIATWQGVSDLNWTVKPGTYWASFAPQDPPMYGVSMGMMQGRAPKPLDHYAYTLDGVTWRPETDPALQSGFPAAASGLGLGIRVAGEPVHPMAMN